MVSTVVTKVSSCIFPTLPIACNCLFSLKNFIRSSHKDKSSIKKEDFERWVSNKLISPYYVVLSDFAKKNISNFNFDLYRPSITPDVEEFYKKEFKDEL